MRSVLLASLLFFVLSFPFDVLAEDVVDTVNDTMASVEGDIPIVEGDIPIVEVDAVTSEIVADAAAPSEESIVVIVQPSTDEEVGETIGLLGKAFNSGTWPVIVGLVIMLLVWAVRRFALKTISEKWKSATPWMAAGLGLLSCIGVSLSAGTMVWWRALIDGLVSGLLASGLWELFGKHVLGKGDSAVSENLSKSE